MVKGKREIMAVDASARALGLKVGMGVAHARALQADLIVADSDPEGDAETLSRLAAWAMRYTPLVAPNLPDGLWLDIAGCAHLFGGEAALLARLTARVAAMGFAAVAAVADTPGAAHAVARFGGGGVVPEGVVAETLEDLPITALRLPPDLAHGLQGLGFMRIHQLAATPRAPLARRFGSLPSLRLDQALGLIPEPIQPIDPPPMPRRYRVLAEPIATAQSLAQVTRDLAADLCGVLEAASQGARRIDLIFHRIDGARLAIRIGTARPSRDAAHLARLLTERLDTVEPGLGIEAMEIAAPQVQPLAAVQVAAMEDGPKPPDLAGLVDRLVNRLGGKRLWRMRPVESHIPERSAGRAPPLAPPCRAEWPADLPRPPRLISHPEPIEAMAMLPDYPPAVFRWRGRRYRVSHGDGPERIHEEWWAGDRPYGVRDYFQVEVEDGGRFWLFRAGDGEAPATGGMGWFLHGAFA